MTADQLTAAIRQIVSTIIGWAKLAAGLGVALVVLATIATITGHPVPYVPAFRGSLQEVGVFVAGFAYWMKNG